MNYEEYNFEVYHCFYKNELVYVGQGKSGRNKHCLSGRSHCKDLNKIVQSEGRDNIFINVVYRTNDRFKARQREKEDIVLLQPKFNKEGKNRWDLLDNKKLRFKEDDVLLLKYFYWRGLDLKDLHNIFHFIPQAKLKLIIDGDYYKFVKLPFLSNSRSSLILNMVELNWFEDKHSDKIKEICNSMDHKAKVKLKDVGIGSVKKDIIKDEVITIDK